MCASSSPGAQRTTCACSLFAEPISSALPVPSKRLAAVARRPLGGASRRRWARLRGRARARLAPGDQRGLRVSTSQSTVVSSAAGRLIQRLAKHRFRAGPGATRPGGYLSDLARQNATVPIDSDRRPLPTMLCGRVRASRRRRLSTPPAFRVRVLCDSGPYDALSQLWRSGHAARILVAGRFPARSVMIGDAHDPIVKRRASGRVTGTYVQTVEGQRRTGVM
jgi:hypothetical protein